jgi:hypothetical protein
MVNKNTDNQFSKEIENQLKQLANIAKKKHQVNIELFEGGGGKSNLW